MNTSKLKKGIVKEFKRSPAKSIVLLLLCPVALYFIAPLVKGVLPKSTKSNKAIAMPASPDGAPFVVPLPTAQPTQVAVPKTNWRAIAQWIEKDQLSKPTHAFTADRSPFVDPTAPDPEIEDEENEEEEEAKRTTTVHDIFNEGYLTLTMTMLGKQRRLATINGKVFSQGDVIPVAVDGGMGRQTLFKLNLTRVERRSAVLTYNEETFRLELQDRIPTDAIILRPARN